jgi:xanthine dehydrogenase accessory factor
MFDLAALTEAVRQHGTVARIAITAHDGSAPREAGTSMLVWARGQSGTIGGGALEWEAVKIARAMKTGAPAKIARMALGPALGQCCGGAVTLLTEVFTAQRLPVPTSGLVLRDLSAQSSSGSTIPLPVARVLAQARAQGVIPSGQTLQGWRIDPLARPTRPLWVWGAGHVGRALVNVLAPLPEFGLTWLDVAPDRFPDPLPDGMTALPAADLAQATRLAPPEAEHLILTFSHSLDLELCHRLLGHGFASCGLIGSATKWARFRARLAALGHTPQAISRITCPIGQPALGKHPQAIAIGVAAHMLAVSTRSLAQEQTG